MAEDTIMFSAEIVTPKIQRLEVHEGNLAVVDHVTAVMGIGRRFTRIMLSSGKFIDTQMPFADVATALEIAELRVGTR